MYKLKSSKFKNGSDTAQSSKSVSTSVRLSRAFRKKLKKFVEKNPEFDGISTLLRESAREKLEEEVENR